MDRRGCARRLFETRSVVRIGLPKSGVRRRGLLTGPGAVAQDRNRVTEDRLERPSLPKGVPSDPSEVECAHGHENPDDNDLPRCQRHHRFRVPNPEEVSDSDDRRREPNDGLPKQLRLC